MQTKPLHTKTKQKTTLDRLGIHAISDIEANCVAKHTQWVAAGEDFQQGWSAILSVFMTAPCFVGVSYLLLLQTYRLRLEYCLCTLQIALYLTEVWYAIVFVFSLCRPVTYD
ncbi:uncharacterized protein LOC120454574 isoform X2 [Drosophila santomea]|uniref:uncharacterized protein LOC120454574 isoform X2 n=1 Tax=Drosophila santomea TaxID=129105 RepID=UPI001952A4FA|nr:uncharacterized protein LOC120454574 isoform X2 [Drosophila santomea]